MAFSDDLNALRSMSVRRMDRCLVNGRCAVDVLDQLLAQMRVSPDVTPVIEALIAVREAEAAYDAAYQAREAARTRLAEEVGVRRRDKDTGFDAEFAARDIIEQAVIAAFQAQQHEQPGS